MRKIRSTLLALLMLGATALFTPKSNAQTYYPPLNSKINPFKQPNQSRELVWDTLSTREQRENLLKKYLAEDKTDTITYRNPEFISGNFATQLNMNFYGTSGFNFSPEDTITFSKYNKINIGKFNVPLYTVGIYSQDGFTHGMNWVFLGDNSNKGDIGNESILDFYDGMFVESQNDSTNVQPGTWNIPSDCTIDIHQIHWYINQNNQNRNINKSFLKFFLKDGNVDSVWYDPNLILTRNSNTQPTASSFITPSDGDTAKYNSGKFLIKYDKSTDPDRNDTLKYLLKIKKIDEPGLDTLINTENDSIEVDKGIFEPSSKYSLEGKVTDGKDTTDFTAPVEFFTPTQTDVVRTNGRDIPNKSSLSQNYPNPFNSNTKIRYNLKKTEDVSLKVYDVLGREIKTLVNSHMPSGQYEVDFDASKLPSGIYFYKFKAGNFVETKKMVVNK